MNSRGCCMPLYDSSVTATGANANAKTSEISTNFIDGGFYTWLKYFLTYTTGFTNDRIFLRGYGENNPFLDQSSTPKIYCELYEFNSPSLSGHLDSSGNVSIFMQSKYRIYFVNDGFRAPFLFEAALKSNPDDLMAVNKKFTETYKNQGLDINIPSNILMHKNKTLSGMSVYPIINYDVELIGYQTHNIEKLKNISFDDIANGIVLKT